MDELDVSFAMLGGELSRLQLSTVDDDKLKLEELKELDMTFTGKELSPELSRLQLTTADDLDEDMELDD